jgi:predicted dehydrogenase/threonine dehydrogenase-like Zn-dependent dehydrogenase
MKQVLQVLGTGEVRVVDVPAPLLRPGGVLVRNQASVISVGTDRTQIDFGRKSLLSKARERPEQVRQVLQSVARDGLRATRDRVRRKLDSHVALGYSCAGVVEAVGAGVDDLRVGMRVACAGAGYASHAERVWVPRNLVVPVPDDVTMEHAAFATMGAIALHGIRQAEPVLGDVVAVIGLGLLGQLTVHMLHAAGVRTIAIDVDSSRVQLAADHGAIGLLRGDAIEQAVAAATDGLGVDAVLITAATSSDDPIRLAGRITRDRGRVVVVGAVPMNVPRSPYYEKEIDLRFSRSYGPGRYDHAYEEKGQDYPVGYIRWTERRNLAEFLRLVGARQVDMNALITHRFTMADAAAAYASLQSANGRAPLGVVLAYPQVGPADGDVAPRIALRESAVRVQHAKAGLGFIGAGSFAADMLLPVLKRLDAELVGVTTARGVSALQAGQQFGFRYLAASPEALMADDDVHAVAIATRHHDHASLAAAALRAGKAVFVEKPLAIDEESLRQVLEAAEQGPPLLVGFNRRFAPATRFVKERLARAHGARVVHIRVNAGAVPADSWVHDPEVGGGRIIGEVCHFIDLARYLAGSPIEDVQAVAVGDPDPGARLHDDVQITLRFADGSIAGILYTARGNTASGKERVEVFAGGMTAVIDDFTSAVVHGARVERWKGRQDKGHEEQLRLFLQALRDGGPSPIPLNELAEVSHMTLRAAAAVTTSHPMEATEITV